MHKNIYISYKEMDQGIIPIYDLAYTSLQSTFSSSNVPTFANSEHVTFALQKNGASDVVYAIGHDIENGMSGQEFLAQRPAL